MKLNFLKFTLMAGMFLIVAAAPSFAMTGLTQVNIKGADSFELIFNGRVGKDQIVTEYLTDIVQVSFKDVSIYPSKMVQVNGENIVKIFAYQYSPKLVRVRFSLKGKAEAFRDRVRVSANGRTVAIQFEGPPNQPVPTPKMAAEKSDLDEKQLLSNVLAAHVTNPVSPTEGIAKAQAELVVQPLAQGPAPVILTGGKPLPSIGSAFGKLGLVLFLMLLSVMGLKKLKSVNPFKSSKWVGAIKRLAPAALGKDGKMIQMVSTHHLDPKKSIAVVRIAGRLLVLGVSNESINLITQISENGEVDDIAEGRPNPLQSIAETSFFSDILDAEKVKPNSGGLPNSPPHGSRSRIRSRLEGLKPL
jgi:flagellar biogenesis protein FliO